MHGDGVVLVGDAAALADPFLGDGIDTALVSGVLAGVHIARACKRNNTHADGLAAYSASVMRVLGPKLAASMALQQARTTSYDQFEREVSAWRSGQSRRRSP